MVHLIDKDALVAEIERRIEALHSTLNERETAVKFELKDFLSFLDTLEVKEVDINRVSENLAEADEYLSYTHTSNLSHNKPMVSASLRRAIKMLYNAGLFQLTHDVRYRMESLGLKAQKGE